MADTGYFSEVCFCRLIFVFGDRVLLLLAQGGHLSNGKYMSCLQAERGVTAFPAATVSQLSSAQKNQCAQVAYSGMAYSDSFHRVYLLLIIRLTWIDSLILSSFRCATPLESMQTAHRQGTSQGRSWPLLCGQFLQQPQCALRWFTHPSFLSPTSLTHLNVSFDASMLYCFLSPLRDKDVEGIDCQRQLF